MTRAELETWAVEQMVAKWGEAERAGCVKMVAAKSTGTLKAEYALATGGKMPRARGKAARGNLDNGHS